MESYASLDQKPFHSLYLHVDTVIDHPVERVWPHALNIGSWMSAHRLETIAGDPGQVGHFERVYPHGVASEAPQPHYHLYGISAVVPLKLIVLEVLPERGGSYGDSHSWMSFDSILLTELGTKTHVTLLMIDVHTDRTDPDRLARRKVEIEAGRKLVDQYFDNLRQLTDRQPK